MRVRASLGRAFAVRRTSIWPILMGSSLSLCYIGKFSISFTRLWIGGGVRVRHLYQGVIFFGGGLTLPTSRFIFGLLIDKV